MEFCPRCGRYLKDDEYQCPECGNVVRQIPYADRQIPPEFREFESQGPDGAIRFDLRKMIFEKWFFVAFGIAFAVSLVLTIIWSFSIILFCVPLLIPIRRISVGTGMMLGLLGGTVTALLVKYFVLDGTL